MVLGRNSLTSQGLIVHPGIIDEDFKEEIKIMAYIKNAVVGLLSCYCFPTSKAPLLQ